LNEDKVLGLYQPRLLSSRLLSCSASVSERFRKRSTSCCCILSSSSRPASVMFTSLARLSFGHDFFTISFFALNRSSKRDMSEFLSSILDLISLAEMLLGCCPFKMRNTLNCCPVIPKDLK